MDYKALLAQLEAERDRLDRAISVLQDLDQEQSAAVMASNSGQRGRGRPVGSRNKPKASTTDLSEDLNGNIRDRSVSFPEDRTHISQDLSI